MDLTQLSSTDLERLEAALAAHRLTFPLTRAALQSEGLDRLSKQLSTLNAAGHAGSLAAVKAVLTERRGRPAQPSLVWTGPESVRSGARDTAVVLQELLGQAKESVLLAGFAFDHAADLLRPLHQALQRGVAARVFADATVARSFVAEHWSFGPPFPEVYGFTPEAGVFASLHAKCVVVDHLWVFVTSANFTDRGQTRNVEVGVVLEDRRLAGILEGQFAGGTWFSRIVL